LADIEGYDLLEKLGEGGMGQVYRALHRRLDRQVAIKRLAPQLSHNQDMLKRFLQEARLQARLPHPNVVSIFDLVENAQGIFLVMEYVEGQTAKALLAGRQRLAPAETLAIAEGVLCGLVFMHKNGVVHRDIKPSNIMVSTDGLIKVTDFGIARLVDEESGLTRFGGGIGTLHYMAPELIRAGTVSFSVDIYSLGATLHELLSGSPPFVGNTDLEIMMGHLEKAPLPLTELPDDEAGRACRDLLAKALAKTPQERFPSAETFLEDVRRIRAMLPPLGPWPAAAPATAGSQAGSEQAPGATAAVSPAGPYAAPRAGLDATLPGQSAEPGGTAQTAPSPPEVATRMPIAPAAPQRPATAGQADVPDPRQERHDAGAPQPRPAAVGRAGGRKALPAVIALAVALGLGGYLVLGGGGTTPAPPVATPQTGPREESSPTPDPAPAGLAAGVMPAEPAQPVQAAPTPPPSAAVAEPRPEATTPPTPTVQAPVPTTTSPDALPPASQVAAKLAPQAPPSPPAQVRPDDGSPSRAASAPADATPSPETAAKPSPGAAPAKPPAKPQARYIAVDDARLREQPSDAAEVLTRLDKGTRLAVLGQDGDWVRVTEPGGRSGYVHASLTTAGAPPSSPPPARPAAKPASPRPAAKSDAPAPSGWRIIK
jgi:hypothetical protein